MLTFILGTVVGVVLAIVVAVVLLVWISADTGWKVHPDD